MPKNSEDNTNYSPLSEQFGSNTEVLNVSNEIQPQAVESNLTTYQDFHQIVNNEPVGDQEVVPISEEPAQFQDKYAINYAVQPINGSYGVNVSQVYRKNDEKRVHYASKRIRSASSGMNANPELEIYFLQQTSHPFVVKFYESFHDTAENCFYIIMEWFEPSLMHWIENKSVGRANIIKWCPQMSLGVGYLHDRGIVHNDLKPANFLINRDGLVRICDFGCAKDLSVNNSDNKPSNLGTPAYMSPERHRGLENSTSGHYDPRKGDIYSLGATFHEMVTYKKPFTGGWYKPLDKTYDINHLNDLIKNMLKRLSSTRFTINQVLDHEFNRERVEEERRTHHLVPNNELHDVEIYQPQEIGSPLSTMNLSQLGPVIPNANGSYPVFDLAMDCTSQQWRELVKNSTSILYLPHIQLSFRQVVLALELRRCDSVLVVGARIFSIPPEMGVDNLGNLKLNISMVIEVTKRGDEATAPETYVLKRKQNVSVTEANFSSWIYFAPVVWDTLDPNKPPKIHLIVLEKSNP